MAIIEPALSEILQQYGILRPETTFLRHSENLTYKVVDSSTGAAYLLRIHKPLMRNMYVDHFSRNGLSCELELLTGLAEQTAMVSQMPIRSLTGDFIVETDYNGEPVPCSLLCWIDGRELTKADVADGKVAFKLGAQIRSLHRYFQGISLPGISERLQYGEEWNNGMLQQIAKGLDKGLFGIAEFEIVERSFRLINSRLRELGSKGRGIVHADLIRSNILVTDAGEYAFIDYGLFGYGYAGLDVAMGAMAVPADNRERLLEGYYGSGQLPENELSLLEGFMLESMFGFYAFQIENEQAYSWIREHMPQFCEKQCRAFLDGRRIINDM